MNNHVWVFMLLIPTLIYSSDHEEEDDFAELLCNPNHHAHDNMNALERLKHVYSDRNVAFIKCAFYDSEQHAIVARYKRYDKRSGDLFVALTKCLENNDIKVYAKKVLHNTAESEIVSCEADPGIVSELKRDIALFEVRFKDHKDRHYYCWQEAANSE